MAEIQWREPEQIVIGDTLSFRRSLPNFAPADGWSLHYVVTHSLAAGVETVTEFDSTAEGDYHAVAVDAFCAGTIEGDDFVLSGQAIKGNEKHTIYYGELTLLANLAAGVASGPITTHAERMIKILQDKLERLESMDISETDVARTRFVLDQKTDTLNRLNQYQEQRFNELKLMRQLNGKNGGDQLAAVFRIA